MALPANLSLSHLTFAILTTLEVRDPLTRRHSGRVARVGLLLAGALGLSRPARKRLWTAALLHDIGKIGVPDGVLHKPGRLDEEERRALQEHPRIGADILLRIRFPREMARMVLHHHERWDGRGYPAGLAGERIPLESRIIALADAYDAMTADRPYRRGLPHRAALEEILDHGGGPVRSPGGGGLPRRGGSAARDEEPAFSGGGGAAAPRGPDALGAPRGGGAPSGLRRGLKSWRISSPGGRADRAAPLGRRNPACGGCSAGGSSGCWR